MMLNFLSKIGRKKIVLDRGPSHPKFIDAKPWINRYYLLFRYRPKWFPFNIILHEMLADDHGEGIHTHLCPYITVILEMVIGKLQKEENSGGILVILDLGQRMIFIELILNLEQNL